MTYIQVVRVAQSRDDRDSMQSLKLQSNALRLVKIGQLDGVLRIAKIIKDQSTKTEDLVKMIPIGQVGFILEGKDSGKYILIIDDTPGTGGYYIFLGNAPNFNNPQYRGELYDYWVEHKEDLDLFFSDMKVKWNQWI